MQAFAGPAELLEQALDASPEQLKAKAANALDQLAEGEHSGIVLFGAGGLGRRVAEGLRSVDVEPLAFSDNNSRLWGTEVCGLPVLSPTEAIERFADQAVFVITIWRWPASESSGRRRADLLALGARHVCSVMPLFWKYPEIFLPYYCLDEPFHVPVAKAEVRHAFGLLADHASRSEFVRQVLWRIDPEGNDLDVTADQTEYFPADLFALGDQEVFIDVGGYDGDTARTFLALTGNKASQIHIVEADPGTFARLEAWRSRLSDDLSVGIFLHNIAVSDSNGTLRFSANSSVASRISSSGTIKVAAQRMDDLLTGVRPTLIKMDIEGAEYAALQGARHLIQTHLPILAICLYHRQSDLWTLPNLVASFAQGYQFFLKAHSLDGWDLVLYAVPAKRCLREPAT
jgi:FkbM family methyltransferase